MLVEEEAGLRSSGTPNALLAQETLLDKSLRTDYESILAHFAGTPGPSPDRAETALGKRPVLSQHSTKDKNCKYTSQGFNDAAVANCVLLVWETRLLISSTKCLSNPSVGLPSIANRVERCWSWILKMAG